MSAALPGQLHLAADGSPEVRADAILADLRRLAVLWAAYCNRHGLRGRSRWG